MPRYTRSNKNKKIEWQEAPDIKKRVGTIVSIIDVDWIKKERIFYFRSKNSKTRAYARIWGLSRIFQMALDIEPAYVLEVISEKFDQLSDSKKYEVMAHELNHIPRNFSGALLPHTRRGKNNFKDRLKQILALKGDPL